MAEDSHHLTGDQILWVPKVLKGASQDISDAVPLIERKRDDAKLGDPTLGQAAPEHHEELVDQKIATAFHEMVPVMQQTLDNLTKQMHYASVGLMKMSKNIALVEDDNLIEKFGNLEKALDWTDKGKW